MTQPQAESVGGSTVDRNGMEWGKGRGRGWWMLPYNAPGNAHRNFCTLTLLFAALFWPSRCFNLHIFI